MQSTNILNAYLCTEYLLCDRCLFSALLPLSLTAVAFKTVSIFENAGENQESRTAKTTVSDSVKNGGCRHSFKCSWERITVNCGNVASISPMIHVTNVKVVYIY